MTEATSIRNRLFHRVLPVVWAATLLSSIPSAANATQIIRDLWDGLPKAAMHGQGSDPTSVGLDTSTNWTVSPAGNTGLMFDNTWDLADFGYDANTSLPPSGGAGGTLAYYGGNMNTLINPATTLPYGHYYSQCYATRALSNSAHINFNANGTYYFSVRMLKGVSWWNWMGDNAGGIGFASSGAANARFVGAGITRSSFYLADGITDAANTCYITTGTLDQPGTGYNADSDGGPYYPRAAGPANMITDFGGILLGKLTTSVGGAATLSVKLLISSTPIPADPNSITWDATYAFNETSVMTHLLVWQYGTGPSVQDALRVGTTWADVVGLEFIGATKASPAATVYAGTTVTLSQTAGLTNATYPMSFQWYSNSVPLLDATNATLVLANPTPSFTTGYSVVVSNYFGTLSNNPIHVTINPATPPFFTLQPVSPVVRYAGGRLTLTVGVDGAPPFHLQLKHAGTNIPGVTASLAGPGRATLTYGPLTLADFAGSYSVTVTNQFGTTNSESVTLSLLTPPAGSFEAAAAAYGPLAFWKLSDTTNGLTSAGVPLKDYASGLDGLVPNAVTFASYTNVAFGVAGPGPVLPGFSGITSIQAPLQNGHSAQINLPSVSYTNRMTMVCWLKILGAGSEGIFYDRNQDSGSAYYGIHNFNGSLGSRWGDDTTSWNSGIVLPTGRWIMVGLVVEPEETTLYAGTDPYTLQSVTRSTVTVVHTNVPGILPNGRLVIGRTDYGWAHSDNAWGFIRGQFCNAAIFNQALTPTQMTNLFVAGFGTVAKIIGQPDGAGNLTLDWYPSLSLQEADPVTGPYTDVLDINSFPVVPPYIVPIDFTTNKYYRVYQVLP